MELCDFCTRTCKLRTACAAAAGMSAPADAYTALLMTFSIRNQRFRKRHFVVAMLMHHHDIVVGMLMHHHDIVVGMLMHHHDIVVGTLMHHHDIVASMLMRHHDIVVGMLMRHHDIVVGILMQTTTSLWAC